MTDNREPKPYAYCERCKTLAGAVCGICRQAKQAPEHKPSCERTTNPNSLHPCDCGRDERWAELADATGLGKLFGPGTGTP